MVFRHHTVLAVISHCYSVAKGRFPRVTHPCATNRPTEVGGSFDLHVLSMPPAFVLSQDQTLKFEPKRNWHGINTANQLCLNFKDPFLHKVITYMDICVRTYVRNELIYNQAPGALKPPDLAPPPTCPFILLSQCQRAYRQKSGHLWFPDITTRGVGDLFVGDQTAETLASRPVNRPLERVWDSVNSHLQFYYKKNAVVV